jgi:hypothetical protein
VKLCMEIPVAHLQDLSPLCEMDFALAHMVLDNRLYAEFYREMSERKREVILDNSFHELGVPLSPVELRLAARAIKPTVVVAPDRLGDRTWNWEQYEETLRVFKKEFPVGIVVTGGEPGMRSSFIAAALSRGCTWFFWPFKEPRELWLREHLREFKRYGTRHHLLGVSTLSELRTCRAMFAEEGIIASVDTSKPIKFGHQMRRFEPGIELRGTGPLRMDAVLTKEELACTYYNVAYLRRFA